MRSTYETRGSEISPPPLRSSFGLLLLFACALSLACPRVGDCTVGTVGCGCTSGGACDPGLTCQSGVCVGPGGAGDPTIEPTTGDALIRFCHERTTEPAGQTIELQVGSQRLAVPSGQCSPAPGKTCLAVPPGPTPVKLTVGGVTTDFGTRVLRPGRAYLFDLDSTTQPDATAVPRAIELESAADCNRLDFKESRWRIDPPLALEPYKADGYTFAKPKGFARVGNEPHTFVFEAPSPSNAAVTRFQISFLGRLPYGQTPSAIDVVEKALTDRGLKTVVPVMGNSYYAAAVGDTGVPGTTRYVMITHHRHWDFEDETAIKERGYSGNAYDHFGAELAFADLTAIDVHALRYVLKSIAWGISIPADPVPSEEIQGTWGSASASTGGFEIKFTGPSTYELQTSYQHPCVMPTPASICPKKVVVTTRSRGLYTAEGGVLVLSPWRCEQEREEEFLQKPIQEACRRDKIPLTLRMERAPDGRIRLGGLGFGVQIADQQLLWPVLRAGGPPGKWTVPTTPAPRPSYGGAWGASENICGPSGEVEPNNRSEEATPIVLGKDFFGCVPGILETDWYEFQAPATGSSGYFVGSIRDGGIGNTKIRIETGGWAFTPEGMSDFLLPEGSNGTPGEPYFFTWTAYPGQRFRYSVENPLNGWFKYQMNVAFFEARDPAGANFSRETAKPLTLGAEVHSLLFATRKGTNYDQGRYDYYSVDLQAGTATIKVDNFPSNLTARVYLYRAGAPTYFYSSARDSPNTQPGEGLALSVPINTAGGYVVEVGSSTLVHYYHLTKNGELPDHYSRQYRLVVTQP